MANEFQRAIYNLANAVPLAVMTALAWYLEYKSWYVPVILIVAAVTVTVLFAICFSYGRKNCSVKSVNVIRINSKDSWLVAYVIAYVLPFAYIVISDYHIVSFIVAALMLALVLIPAIMALPNVLLFFVGYHFYEIETESSIVGDYILISKRRRIRNKSDVETVLRVFEKLLIDAKGEK
jgi:hypothetical protein